ncbi:hypothetical protein RB195_020960 [Necator americanus]|uniref:UmuC domain-containing protein n=1 Tax=Necator americanus TaxID=51031 RepID=A0ABR1CPT9_NECAM
MVRRQVDMAVEKIRIEVVDDFLHLPSRCNGGSLRVPEIRHPCLAAGEVSTSIADAFRRLCSFSQHFCWCLPLSLTGSFIDSLQSLASTDVSSSFPAARAAPRWRISSRVSRDRRLLVILDLSAFFARREGIQRADHIPRRCCPLRNLPKSRLT